MCARAASGHEEGSRGVRTARHRNRASAGQLAVLPAPNRIGVPVRNCRERKLGRREDICVRQAGRGVSSALRSGRGALPGDAGLDAGRRAEDTQSLPHKARRLFARTSRRADRRAQEVRLVSRLLRLRTRRRRGALAQGRAEPHGRGIRSRSCRSRQPRGAAPSGEDVGHNPEDDGKAQGDRRDGFNSAPQKGRARNPARRVLGPCARRARSRRPRVRRRGVRSERTCRRMPFVRRA